MCCVVTCVGFHGHMIVLLKVECGSQNSTKLAECSFFSLFTFNCQLSKGTAQIKQ